MFPVKPAVEAVRLQHESAVEEVCAGCRQDRRLAVQSNRPMVRPVCNMVWWECPKCGKAGFLQNVRRIKRVKNKKIDSYHQGNSCFCPTDLNSDLRVGVDVEVGVCLVCVCMCGVCVRACLWFLCVESTLCWSSLADLTPEHHTSACISRFAGFREATR